MLRTPRADNPRLKVTSLLKPYGGKGGLFCFLIRENNIFFYKLQISYKLKNNPLHMENRGIYLLFFLYMAVFFVDNG
jgi:hypothetical protein